MFTKVKELFQKETVCCIAFLLAVISMCFVVPSKNYISYIYPAWDHALNPCAFPSDAVGTFHFPVLFLQHAYHQ